MDAQAIMSLLIVAVLAFFISVFVTWIMRKIHRSFVFVLPIGLSVYTGYMAVWIFSGEAGWGAIFLIGFMIIFALASLISWSVALYAFFKSRD